MSAAVAPGVHSVLVTPFRADESLDLESAGRLVDHVVDAGVAGVLVLGVMGEADRLSDRERDRLLAAVLEAVAGRVQVTVGISHRATVVAVERGLAAERRGADAVMVALAPGGDPLEQVRRVAAGPALPVVVQDYPAASGVHLPVDALAVLARSLPSGSAVKLEDPPAAPKVARLVRAAPALRVFGGLGGVALLDELEAGAAGTMTGFALPALLVGIVEAHARGDRDGARAAFESAKPLLAFEAQPAGGLALRKEILRRLGVLATATLRAPAPGLDATLLRPLDALLDRHAAVVA